MLLTWRRFSRYHAVTEQRRRKAGFRKRRMTQNHMGAKGTFPVRAAKSSRLAPVPAGTSPAIGTILTNEKRILLCFRLVVAAAAFAIFSSVPPGTHVPWQFYFILTVLLLSNGAFFFESVSVFNTQRVQFLILTFDMSILSILLFYLGLTNKEFYLVLLLTVFVSAVSKKLSYSLIISVITAGIYLVFAIKGDTDTEVVSAMFFARLALFFVVSSFVGHISESDEKRRRGLARLTEQKGRLEELAVEQDKMAAVGLLAAGVAHEFNNLLTCIKGYAQLSGVGKKTPEEYLDLIEGRCDEAAEVVQDLIAFSQMRGNKRLIDPHEALNHTLHLVSKELIARNLKPQQDLAQVPRIMAEQGAIERIALNLLSNAMDAMEDGGSLSIRLAADDRWVILSVADDGQGMTAEELAHAFEPFYSTKGITGVGRVRAPGLGLSVSKGLAERSGGKIEIDSEPGVGTTVAVSLPVVRERAEASDEDQSGETGKVTDAPAPAEPA